MTDPPDWFVDSEQSSRPVSVVGLQLETKGLESPWHQHAAGLLVLTVRGVTRCRADAGLWMVPPGCAVWIPGGTAHSVHTFGDLAIYLLFVAPAFADGLPEQCCTIAVSPLLRELVIEAARLPEHYDEDGPAQHLLGAALDQLRSAPLEQLHLPLPSDPRLRQIFDGLSDDPSDRSTVGQWARRVAMSERTLNRLVTKETGMSFGRWRQQFHLSLALERLAEGRTVQSVANDLGYESASAFVTMFHRALGASPTAYLASRASYAQPDPVPFSDDGPRARTELAPVLLERHHSGGRPYRICCDNAAAESWERDVQERAYSPPPAERRSRV